MGFFKKATAFLGIVGAGGAIEQGAAHASEAAGHQETATTAHVEKYVSPERVIADAKQQVVDELNESSFDETSGGTLEGKGWKAQVVREADGTLVVKVTVEAGNEALKREFVIREDEKTDNTGNIKTIRSLATGVDRREEELLRSAQATVDAALGKKGPGGSGPVAMEDGE